MRVAPPHGRSNHPSEAERIWLWTARTATHFLDNRRVLFIQGRAPALPAPTGDDRSLNRRNPFTAGTAPASDVGALVRPGGLPGCKPDGCNGDMI